MVYLNRDGRLLPCEPQSWTPAGKVQVKRTRVIGCIYPAVLGIYEAVPFTALSHSDGRAALVATLRGLPTERAA